VNIFARILVGVDGSNPSDDAALLAGRLAREAGGEVVLCHIVNWMPLVVQTSTGAPAADVGPIIDTMRSAGEAMLAAAAAKLEAEGVSTVCSNLDGDPAGAILAEAVAKSCTLILMGTHGRRGIQRFFVGSTTESVLRQSTVPVLTLRAAAATAAAGRPSFERVLVAVDDSEPSDAAVAAALALAAGGKRHLVFGAVADASGVAAERSYLYSGISEEEYADARENVGRAVAAARKAGVAAEERIVEGSAGDEIVALSATVNADLIVVGSHGRRGIRRFFLGSVAEHVVRTATVPVLVVRSAG
jgi:nucleotide-binding universal stress UspA family protein